MSAEDAARSANGRLNSLPDDADPQMRQRLADERNKHNHRFAQLSQLISRVQQWIVQQRADVALASVPLVPADLGAGETPSAAIATVRDEIAALGQQLATVRRAPLPLAEKRKLVDDYVVRLIRQGRPSVTVVNGALRVTFRGDMAAAEDVLALLAWGRSGLVCDALDREVEKLPEHADPMPTAERLARVAEIEGQMLDLERREEALVLRAAGDGLEVLRRPDASPLAVLGVMIAAAAAKEAVSVA
jgi:hypothetical protein